MAVGTATPLLTFLRIVGPHVILVLVLIAYSALGGYIFSTLEDENYQQKLTEKTKELSNLGSQLKELESDLLESFGSNGSTSVNASFITIFEQFRNIHKDTVNAERNKAELKESPWDIWGGTFFAATLSTTIGYGNYAPETVNGRLAAIMYSFFGIPLVITVLNDWGNILFNVSGQSYRMFNELFRKRNCCANRCRRRKGGRSPSYQHQSSDMPTDLPFLLVMFLLTFCILILSIIVYYQHENEWTFFEAVYFAWITLTTIGLGDFVPDDKKKAVLNFSIVLIALSMVSMAINIVQAKLEVAFHGFISAIDSDFKRRLDATQDSISKSASSEGKPYASQPSAPTAPTPTGKCSRSHSESATVSFLNIESHAF